MSQLEDQEFRVNNDQLAEAKSQLLDQGMPVIGAGVTMLPLWGYWGWLPIQPDAEELDLPLIYEFGNILHVGINMGIPKWGSVKRYRSFHDPIFH